MWHEMVVKALQDDSAAQYKPGALYEMGKGVPQNDAGPAKWYRLAAEQGVAQARMSLGVFHASGTGIGQDAAEAGKWFRRAAARGHAVAQVNLRALSERGLP